MEVKKLTDSLLSFHKGETTIRRRIGHHLYFKFAVCYLLKTSRLIPVSRDKRYYNTKKTIVKGNLAPILKQFLFLIKIKDQSAKFGPRIF